MVESEITADQSSFKTIDISHPVTSDDRWFRPVDIKVGPDGAIYLCDWYDQQVNHYRNHEGQIDTSNGRVYRIKARGAKPAPPFALNKLHSTGLVGLLGHTNKWFRQTALRLLADRKDSSILPQLKRRLAEKSVGQLSLEYLWALHLSGGLDENTALQMLGHPDPFVRLWTARLLCDANRVSPETAEKLAGLAQTETNLESTQSQLSCHYRKFSQAPD